MSAIVSNYRAEPHAERNRRGSARSTGCHCDVWSPQSSGRPV